MNGSLKAAGVIIAAIAALVVVGTTLGWAPWTLMTKEEAKEKHEAIEDKIVKSEEAQNKVTEALLHRIETREKVVDKRDDRQQKEIDEAVNETRYILRELLRDARRRPR
jgi:uncharacterized protein HemX